jgi:hypothetical protein
MPVTTPEEVPIVATAGLLLVHVPPGVASVSVMVVPRQTLDDPEMEAGDGLTVTTALTVQPLPSE